MHAIPEPAKVIFEVDANVSTLSNVPAFLATSKMFLSLSLFS